MVGMVVATLPAMVRPFVKATLPEWLAPRWAATQQEAGTRW